MTKLFKFTLGTAIVVLLGLMMSCNNQNEEELGLENQGKGTVVFKITDAPFPVDLVEEANVTIDWIKLLKYPAEGTEEEATGDDDVILIELEEPETYNLIELRNGLTATMAEMEIPAGVYSEIRLHVIDAGILLKDGTSHSLKVPSGDASGLKIKLEPGLEVVEGLQAVVLVDFDLSRSFVMRGNAKNNNGFIFKPVVRAVANVETAAGEISGKVTILDENLTGDVMLTLYQEEEEVITATPEEDGSYAMVAILPGTYELVLQVVNEEVVEFSQTVPVTVEAGITTVVDFTVEEDTETTDTTDGGNTEGTSGN